MIKENDIILEARNLAVEFKVEGGVVKAVKNMNFALRKGETIAIVGESGSGKSVTARAVMRLCPSARRSPRVRPSSWAGRCSHPS